MWESPLSGSMLKRVEQILKSHRAAHNHHSLPNHKIDARGISLEKRHKDEGVFNRYAIFHGGASEGVFKTYK
jgi:hypothetical protein